MSNPETSTWTGVVPGYSDGVLPHAYAFSIPGKGIRTDRGMVPLPGANSAAGYVRMSDDGVLLLCQGQTDDRAWLWSGVAWTNIGIAWGPNAVIFGPDGAPVINDTQAKFQATGGLRAVVNGVVIGCTATYADPSRGLYEYTEWPDVAIGQGGKDINQGAVVRFADDGILRRFQEGVIRNVRVHRVGNDFAITTLDYATATARVTWRTLAELRALPPVVAGPPVEPPVDPPVEPPVHPPIPPVDPPVDPPPVDPPPVQPPTLGQPIMIFLDKNDSHGGAYVCQSEDIGGGKIALKDVVDGLYLSCDPDSGVLLKQTSVGPWEEFKKGSNGIVSDVDWNGRKAHIFAYVEVE